MILVTHYQRLLNYIVPDFVHVLVGGRIVRSGGKELALELEDTRLRLDQGGGRVTAMARLGRLPRSRRRAVPGRLRLLTRNGSAARRGCASCARRCLGAFRDAGFRRPRRGLEVHQRRADRSDDAFRAAALADGTTREASRAASTISAATGWLAAHLRERPIPTGSVAQLGLPA